MASPRDDQRAPSLTAASPKRGRLGGCSRLKVHVISPSTLYHTAPLHAITFQAGTARAAPLYRSSACTFERSRRPLQGKDLLIRTQHALSAGKRDARVVALVATRGPPPRAVAVADGLARIVADVTLSAWEGASALQGQPGDGAARQWHWRLAKDSDEPDEPDEAAGLLADYVEKLICCSRSNAATALLAIVYIARLRRLHPHAAGQDGCGHRLFTVSLLVASKYHMPGPASPALPSSYEAWSRHTGGLFSARDLLKMEVELVSFLAFDLFVAYEALEYLLYATLEGRLQAHIDQRRIVPASADLGRALASLCTGPSEEDLPDCSSRCVPSYSAPRSAASDAWLI